MQLACRVCAAVAHGGCTADTQGELASFPIASRSTNALLTPFAIYLCRATFDHVCMASIRCHLYTESDAMQVVSQRSKRADKEEGGSAEAREVTHCEGEFEFGINISTVLASASASFFNVSYLLELRTCLRSRQLTNLSRCAGHQRSHHYACMRNCQPNKRISWLKQDRILHRGAGGYPTMVVRRSNPTKLTRDMIVCNQVTICRTLVDDGIFILH